MKLEKLPTEDRARVAALHENCTEEGDCLLWNGRVTASGYPVEWRDGRNSIIRRQMAAMKMGRPLRKDEVAACSCGNPLCLEWAHIRVMTVKQRRAMTGAAGGYSGAAKGIRIALTQRKTAKLIGGEQAAQAIREDPRPSHEVCGEHGISPSMVRRIRSGKAWRPLTSPFMGLGARA